MCLQNQIVWDAHCMSPGSVTNPYGPLYRCQGPACTSRVAASEAKKVTANGTSLAGRFGEIQVPLSKHNPLQNIVLGEYITQITQQLYKEGTGSLFSRKQRLWWRGGWWASSSIAKVIWPENNRARIQTQAFKLLVSVLFHSVGCSHGNPIKLPKQW